MNALSNNTLTAASKQWASRPADERFTSLIDMQNHFDLLRRNSAAKVVPSSVLTAEPTNEGSHSYRSTPRTAGYRSGGAAHLRDAALRNRQCSPAYARGYARVSRSSRNDGAAREADRARICADHHRTSDFWEGCT